MNNAGLKYKSDDALVIHIPVLRVSPDVSFTDAPDSAGKSKSAVIKRGGIGMVFIECIPIPYKNNSGILTDQLAKNLKLGVIPIRLGITFYHGANQAAKQNNRQESLFYYSTGREIRQNENSCSNIHWVKLIYEYWDLMRCQ